MYKIIKKRLSAPQKIIFGTLVLLVTGLIGLALGLNAGVLASLNDSDTSSFNTQIGLVNLGVAATTLDFPISDLNPTSSPEQRWVRISRPDNTLQLPANLYVGARVDATSDAAFPTASNADWSTGLALRIAYCASTNWNASPAPTCATELKEVDTNTSVGGGYGTPLPISPGVFTTPILISPNQFLSANSDASFVITTTPQDYAPNSLQAASADLQLRFTANLAGEDLPTGAPTATTIPTCTGGLSVVDVAWSADSDQGSTITDYIVEYSSNEGTTWSTFSDGTSTSPTTTVTGLLGGTTYLFRVSAVNAIGTSTFQQSAPCTPYDYPTAPTAPIGTVGQEEVSLEWLQPASNGSAIIGYVVQYSLNAGSSWQSSAVDEDTPPLTTRTVTNLSSSTPYIFRVAAQNVAGLGNYSTVSSIYIPYGPPGTPTSLAGTAGNTTVALTWTAPASDGGSALTDYNIQSSSDDGSTWSTFADGTSTTASTTVTGLTNGTSYVFRVRAVNANGAGSYTAASSQVTPATVPGTPTSLAGTAGNTTVALTWTAPASDGGSALTDYNIQSSSDDGSTWSTFADGTSTTTSTTVTGLTNGTSYIFRVRAVNAAGAGSYTAASSQVTPSTPRIYR